ncbi:MAG: MFS transporter [Oscillospiraceae bacterium]|jgi:PPP family 3-phenylpropionic acid transporter|nr:MFS transporter [Oscillospiraceae bacterium]
MKNIYRFYLMSLILYSMITLYNSYIPLKLSFLEMDSKGVLLAISPVVSLFAPMLWGILADRMSSRKKLLSTLCLFGGASFLAICLNTAYGLLFLSVFLYSLFASSYGSLSDTLSLSYCSEFNLPYGRIRLMGTLGYGIFAVLSGVLMNFSDYSLPALYLLLAAAAFIVIRLLPENGHLPEAPKAPKERSGFWESLRELLRIPHLPQILFLILAVHAPLNYFYSFYSEYFIYSLGNPEWHWGLLVLATVVGEVPLLMFLNRLINRFHYRTLFIASGVLTILRYALLICLQNIVAITVVSLATGYVTTLAFYAATTYLHQKTPERIRATCQSILYSTAALSGIAANLLGGVAAKLLGVRAGMGAAVIFTALAVLLLLPCRFSRSTD